MTITLSSKDYNSTRGPDTAAQENAKRQGCTQKVVGDVAWRNPRNRKRYIKFVKSSRDSHSITVYVSGIESRIEIKIVC